MTEHKPITNRSFAALMVPMTLAYLSTPLLGLVDTAVIGQLGVAALLGGLAIGALIFDFIGSLFYCLRAGTTALAAQTMGRCDSEGGRYVLLRGLLVALGSGFIMLLLAYPILKAGLWALGGSAQVQAAATDYFSVRALSAPLMLANYVLLGWLVGQARAGAGLALQTLLNGLNAVLSYVLALEMNLGIFGVALATVMAEAVTFIMGSVLCLALSGGLRKISWARLLNKQKMLDLFALNRDIMIRSFCLLFAFGFFTARSAAQGDVILATNALLERFFLVGGYFLDGAASAAEQLVGRTFGAKDWRGLRKALRLTYIWSYGLSIALSVVFFFSGTALIELMTTSEEVRELASAYLWVAVLCPIVGNLAFQMDGVFIGASWSGDMRNMMLLSVLLFLLAYVVLFPVFGNAGLWWALLVFLGARGVTLWVLLQRRLGVFAAT
ncbi:MATE family efflux transporter [Polycladidibacter hongkongensis]|uniref:MATE family efflux transporter n=1 Tax=Polycladidibacter hongkongensis TaxID=1647556 RepID=UPI0008371C3C|nr:MATE family efflux transporter [Pseudovibrio hongkongensis]